MRFVGARPQACIALPQAPYPPLDPRAVERGGYCLGQGNRQFAGQRVQPVAKKRRPLVGDGSQQRIGCGRKLRDAIGHQRAGHAIKVKPKGGSLGQLRTGLARIGGQRRGDMAMVAERIHGPGRDRVDGVRPDQAFDIQYVAEFRVLGAGRRPQQPLRHRTLGGQGLPARASDHVAIPGIGDFCAGDGDLAGERCRLDRPRIARSVQPGDLEIDLGVDPAEKEACHAGYAVNRLAHRNPRLKPGHIGLGHGDIGGDRKQQRDVDVEALFDQPGDGRYARSGARHLDHYIGPGDAVPQPPGLGNRGIGDIGQIGRYFEADIPVAAIQPVIDGA